MEIGAGVGVTRNQKAGGKMIRRMIEVGITGVEETTRRKEKEGDHGRIAIIGGETRKKRSQATYTLASRGHHHNPHRHQSLHLITMSTRVKIRAEMKWKLLRDTNYIWRGSVKRG